MFENLGLALFVVRSLKGRSQGDVSREAGLGRSQLSKYETGRVLPRLDTLRKLLQVLGTGLADFFYLVDFLGTFPRPLSTPHSGLLRSDVDQAFTHVLSGLVALHTVLLEHRVQPPLSTFAPGKKP